jgi:hypothetical protein
MDPQSMAQKAQDIEAIRHSIAADVASVETVFIIIVCLMVCWAVFMIGALWHSAQHESAARRASWYGRLLHWRRHTDQAQAC